MPPTQIVFMREIPAGDRTVLDEAVHDGYDELRRHADVKHDVITPFEYFITHVDDSVELRAYGYSGLDIYEAKIIQRPV